MLTKDPSVKKYDLSSLERLLTGGAPVSAESMAIVREMFPQVVAGQRKYSTSTPSNGNPIAHMVKYIF